MAPLRHSMPEAIAPVPPPAAPVTPESSPITPPEGGQDPTAPAVPPQTRAEDDPNHQMALLISKREERKAAKAAKEAENQGKTGEGSPPVEPPKKGEKLGDLIADALKFKGKKPETPTKPQEPSPTTPPKAAAPPVPPPEPPKTVVTKRQPAPQPQDTAAIASQAATAAATAAISALQPSLKHTPSTLDPGDTLRGEDRREYEVAKYLAARDPKYKDAPAIILDQVKKAESYAARWEATNQGKVFDPNDDEHNDFYDSLTKPWSDVEFEDIKIEMVAERIADKKTRESQAKLAAMEQDNARLELAPRVGQTFTQAAGMLAKSLGQDVFDKVSKEGFDALSEADPIVANVLAGTLGELQPIIETIIQIDDPKGRIRIDMNNPLHQQWNEIVTEGETRCFGQKDESGRMFAKRADYVRMNDSQRARHWFLTSDQIVTGLVEEASKVLTGYVQREKERQKKIAESLGYIQKPQNNGGKEKSGATKSKEEETPETPAPPVKPASPTVGSGAKIDGTTNVNPTGRAALMDAITNVLWKK